jgi:hypothetical protein
LGKQVLQAKAEQIDVAVKRLRAMRKGLRHGTECHAASHAQCPTLKQPQLACSFAPRCI